MNIDESTGTRTIIRYRDNNLYLNIFPEAKEVFISSVFDSDMKTAAGITAITRMTSKLWQHVGLDICIDQLTKSGCCAHDLPTIIVKELKKLGISKTSPDQD